MGCSCVKQITDLPSPSIHTLEIIEKSDLKCENFQANYYKVQPIPMSSDSSILADVPLSSYIYYIDLNEHPQMIFEYNLTLAQIEKIEIPVRLFQECAMIEIYSGDIWCAGGLDSEMNQEVKNCLLINPLVREIHEMASLVNAKRRARLIEFDNVIYCIGGVREKVERTEKLLKVYQEYSKNFESFSFSSNKWQELPCLPFGVEYPACCVLHTDIYVCGGGCVNGFDFTLVDHIQVFSITSLTWKLSPLKLLEPVYGALSIQINPAEFLIIGGSQSHSSKCSTYKCNGKQLELISENTTSNLFLPHYCIKKDNEIISVTEDCGLFTLNFLLNSASLVMLSPDL